MSDDDKTRLEEIAEDHASWLGHPYTRKLIPDAEARLNTQMEQLLGCALVSTDPRVASKGFQIMALRETLKTLRGDTT